MKLPKILPAPEIPQGLPKSAQWLAGEGAGSWFVILPDVIEGRYLIERFAPDGARECSNIFIPNIEFQFEKPYRIDYPSHCATVTVIQRGTRVTFSNF